MDLRQNMAFRSRGILECPPIPFLDFLSALTSRFPLATGGPAGLEAFREPYEALWGHRWEYRTRGVARFLGLALLTAQRYSQVAKASAELLGDVLRVTTPGAKGGRETTGDYRLSGGALQWAREAIASPVEVPGPDSLAFLLKRAAPSVYDSPVQGHHALSHLPRYFTINLLCYGLGVRRDEIAGFLGLEEEDTLGYYMDLGFVKDIH